MPTTFVSFRILLPMTPPLSEQLLLAAASTVLNAREFCGQERVALSDWAADHHVTLSDVDTRAVFAIVESRWHDSRRTAGVVHAITPTERVAIDRIFSEAS